MSEPFSPVGALETLIIAKEATFGQKAGMGSGVGQAFTSFPSSIGVRTVARAPRGSLFMPVPGPGGRVVATSLDVETTADTIAQIIAYGLGKQTITNSSAMYSGTLQSAIAIGDTVMKLTANTLFTPALIFPGMTLSVDTSTNMEQALITSVKWSGPGMQPTGWINVGCSVVGSLTGFTKTHASGIVVVGQTSSKNPLNVISSGSPLPTFTAQTNRPGGIATNKLGCKIDQMAFGWQKGGALTCKASIVAQDEQLEPSPTTATLSSKYPYIFEQEFVPPTLGTNALSNGANSSLRSFSLTVNNNLIKDNYVGGGGNLVYSFPEQARSISASVVLGFETSEEFTTFQAAAAGGAFSSIPFVMPFQSLDTIGATGMPFFMVFYMPKVAISKWGATDDTGKEITQSLTLEVGDSTPGAGDALQVFAPQASTSAF